MSLREGNRYETPQELLRQIVIDWSPFAALIIIYAVLQRIVERFRDVNVIGVYNLEKVMFGWMSNGYGVPAFAFADIFNPFLIIFSTVFYSTHFVVPSIVALYIGYYRPDRETFSKLRISIIVVTAISLTSFIIYPVAPPWYVLNYGLVQPVNFAGTTETAAGLLKFDKLFGITFFSNLYDSTPPAPFAAFPSLHASYSFLIAFVLGRSYGKRDKRIYLMYLYPISVWFATVYLQHHYIVDLIGGAIYSLISYFVGIRILLPLWHKIFNTKDTTESEEELVEINPEEKAPNGPSNGDTNGSSVGIEQESKEKEQSQMIKKTSDN